LILNLIRKESKMKKLLASLLFVLSASAFAQQIQSVLITMPPGSGTDVQARQVIKRHNEIYAVPTLIQNRPGAEGVIGITQVLNDMPTDTLIFPSTGHVVGLNADLHGRVEPLIEVLRQPFLFVIQKSIPVNNWNEFVEYVRARPGKVNMGIGAKAMALPVMLEIERRNGIKFNHVFYGSTTGARGDLDVANGSLDCFMSIASLTLGSGVEPRVKIIGVTSSTPIPGIDPKAMVGNNPKVGSWYVHQGIYVNSDINPAVKKKLNAQFNEIVQSQWAKETFGKRGIQPTGGTPEEFAKVNKDAWTRWQKVENK
jgi:tripartite-type tricarboxylate transporter receptor subunit TctC